MQSIELTAKSLDEAKAEAAAKLGVSPDALTVTVLEEAKGLFGKATVRIRAEAPAAEPMPEPEPEPVITAPQPDPEPEGQVTAYEEAEAIDEEEEESEVAVDDVKATEESRDAVTATEEDASAMVAWVTELLSTTGLTVSVRSTGVQARYVNLVIDGKDAGYLVGKTGDVLNSLQYLINLSAPQKIRQGVRCTLDANDFRKRREDQLVDLAQKIAAQVIERGEEAVLDALPAFERRVIHKALGEIEGVTTYSEGEEPNRRVVIAPEA
ncbi:MAG: RNA-binding cell elongation regulator Jag/EloR [Fimbriimonadaceae bacterium]